jgi:hypothetical protein
MWLCACHGRGVEARIACVECVQGVKAGRAVFLPLPGVRSCAHTSRITCENAS